MKTIILLTSLLLSSAVSANQDHESGMEAMPDDTRLQITRACFDQLARLGCGHPNEDREHFVNCARDQITDLDSDCQGLVKKLYR